MYSQKGTSTFAFVVEEDNTAYSLNLAEAISSLLNEVQRVIQEARQGSVLHCSMPAISVAHGPIRELDGSVLTVTKILEPQDKHIVLTSNRYTSSSQSFSSHASSLFKVKDVLRRFEQFFTPCLLVCF